MVCVDMFWGVAKSENSANQRETLRCRKSYQMRLKRQKQGSLLWVSYVRGDSDITMITPPSR